MLFEFLVLGGLVGLLLVARFVAKFLKARDAKSSFFDEVVDREFKMDFADQERETFEMLRSRIREKRDPDGTDENWYAKLVQAESRNFLKLFDGLVWLVWVEERVESCLGVGISS